MLKIAGKIVSVAGFLAGVVSVTLLLRQGFLIDFVAPLRIMAEWYETALGFVLSPLKPVMLALLDLMRLISPDYRLSPGWRHHLVAGTVMLGGCLRAGRSEVYVLTGLAAFVMSVLTAFEADAASGLEMSAILVGVIVLSCFVRALFGSLWRLRRAAKPAGPDDMLWKDAWAMSVSILAVIVGAAVFVALNAGLKLAGL